MAFPNEVEDVDTGERGIVLTRGVERVKMRQREGVWVYFYGGVRPEFVPEAELRVTNTRVVQSWRGW